MDVSIPSQSGNSDLSEDFMIKRIDDDEAIMASLEDTLNDLISLENEVLQEGLVCKAQAIAYESITGQSIDPYAPVAGFTELPSVTSRDALIMALQEGRAEIVSKELTTFVHALVSIVDNSSRYSIGRIENARRYINGPFDVSFISTKWASFVKDLSAFLEGLGASHPASQLYHERSWKVLKEWIESTKQPYVHQFFGDDGLSKAILAKTATDIGNISFTMISRLEALKNRLIAINQDKASITAEFIATLGAPIVSEAAMLIDRTKPAADVLYEYLTQKVANATVVETEESDVGIKAWLNKVMEYTDGVMADVVAEGKSLDDAMLPEKMAIASVREAISVFRNELGIQIVSKDDMDNDNNNESYLRMSVAMSTDVNEQQQLIVALKSFFSSTIRIWANLIEIYNIGTIKIHEFINEILRRLLVIFYTDEFAKAIEETSPEHLDAYRSLRDRLTGYRKD